MVAAGYSPSVRSSKRRVRDADHQRLLGRSGETSFEPGREILIARISEDMLRDLRDIPETERVRSAPRPRARTPAAHTAAHRAEELERRTRWELLGKQTKTQNVQR